MTLLEFQQSLKEDQAHLIWQKGVFLLSRSYKKHRIFLYDLGSFYAEIWYHREANKIIIIRSFKNTISLKPYLDQIDCSDLDF